VGDAALVRFFDGSLEEANELARAHAASLRAIPNLLDVVPAARSVLVRIAPGTEPSPELLEAMRRDPVPARPGTHEQGEVVSIPVSYGGADGPDLADLARAANMSERDVVAVHTDARYRVAFMGFLPGFAYLLGLPPALHMPRLETPRTSVPAGSVAIARHWTGVYPTSTPGGWRIIGRTDAALFDPGRDPPALLSDGAVVAFVEP
jgi:KipI family sensor histidine kinase inhibitor